MACVTGSTRMPDSADAGVPREIGAPILEVTDLRTWFFTDAGVVRAVDGISFRLHPGETLGIVGESGSGKSVAAKSIIRLLDEPARIVEGSVRFRGRELTTLPEPEIRAIRGAEIATIFQDPGAWESPRPIARSIRSHTSSPVECASALCWRWALPTSRRSS
jgi:ABC-type glutathione transport system ATPase component